MPKYKFFDNEKAIRFHKNSGNGSKMAAEDRQASLFAHEFVKGECHPDFWTDYLNGQLEWITEELAKATNAYKSD
jgi:hypothetical protein